MKLKLAMLGLLLGGVFGAQPTGCAAPQYTDHGITFEFQELVTGSASSQVVLAGSFLGGPALDLAVVSVHGPSERRVRIYALEEGSWGPAVDAPLRAGVSFVDVARVGGRDRLLTHEDGQLRWFDPATGAEHPLVEVPSEFRGTGGDRVPHVDVARDLNGDGLDDLVMPTVEGFWISTQSTGGSFAAPVRLGPPEPFREAIALESSIRYGEVGITAETLPSYLSRVHGLDWDRDGRDDLAFWNGDRFDVHRQRSGGSFDPVPAPFGVDVAFDSDGVYSHVFGYEEESELALLVGARERTERTVLHSFRDVNGDGVPDLVTHSLAGRSVIRLQTRLAVHLGGETPDGLRFAPEAGATIRANGSQPAGYSLQQLVDLDGDGRLEVFLLNVEAGIGDMFQALVANSIDLELEFFRLEDGVYPDEPGTARSVRPDSELFGGRGPFFPTVLLGDVDGDGRADLLAAQSWEELRIYPGVPGPGLFAEEPQRVGFDLPANEANARALDLDGDGRDDVLVHHPAADGPHRLTMLIVR